MKGFLVYGVLTDVFVFFEEGGFDVLPFIDSDHSVVVLLDVDGQQFELGVGGEGEFLHYGEIEFDAASVESIHLYVLFVFGLGKFFVLGTVVFGEGGQRKLEDLFLFLLLKAEELE